MNSWQFALVEPCKKAYAGTPDAFRERAARVAGGPSFHG